MFANAKRGYQKNNSTIQLLELGTGGSGKSSL
jgi:GTPase SAR1 family protein